ncbi:MAG: sigma-70 family RNA polymerase sigma factor, partial [Oscillospiraceae bacterium]|nr:sigma-70 family RNA polymerase sigma factor [Oscillospiraceae bacterium]
MSNIDIASRFDEIYNATNRTVLMLITAKCGRTADISDIFQDTYMELYQVLSKRGVDYVTNEKALVIRIAKRKIARYYSLLERVKNFVSINAVNEDGNEIEIFEKEAKAFFVEDFSIDHILLETAKEFIHTKSEDVQKVIYLRFYGDLSITEIAQALSISETNVKNKLYRTIKELRDL